MVDRPSCEVVVDLAPSPQFKPAPANEAESRAWDFFGRFWRSMSSLERRALDERLRVGVVTAAPQHVGLGTGTQLGLAVAKALAIWADKSGWPAEELARRIGRGARSAIGIHGFNCGGFIVEGGKTDPAAISPMVARLNFPPEWHFVLLIPKDSQGLHGPAEREAFDGLTSIPPAVTAELCRLTMLGMMPALAERDFQAFSESLVEFGRKVGECFAAHQGGVYASPLAGAAIDLLRQYGIRGVAQSSWGPTLAAVCDSRFRAEWLVARLADSFGPDQATICGTPANNTGAKIEVVNSK
jgi:beta-RFAP synthase